VKRWLCSIGAHAWTLGYIAVIVTVSLILLIRSR